MRADYDVLVVGGGTAGIVSAKTASRFGARVLLVERAKTGGDCLWTGCVPSKSLLAAANAAAAARAASSVGVHVSDVRVDFAQVKKHVAASIERIAPVDSPAALEQAGVTVATGTLSFTGPRNAEIDGRPVRFTQAIVCTGSAPALPPIPGLDESCPVTSDSVWGLDRLPPRLAVLGGGNIGCELGQAFARLGSEVTIIEGADRVLPREDPAASAAVERSLVDDGVKVLTGSPVDRVHASGGGQPGGRLALADGSEVAFTQLLVAVGRKPRSAGLDLDRAGVEVDDRGNVVVDARLRTTNPVIWAAGDITGHPQFTHLAGMHGSIAATNATLGLRRKVDMLVPRVTFTSPEVAAVGVGTGGERPELRVLTWNHSELDRAVTENETAGFTRLAIDVKGRVLGATIVGPRAGETLAELTLAIRNGMRTRDLAGTTHPYPTYGDGPWNAAIADIRVRLARPPVSSGTRLLVAGRRAWLTAMARGARARG